MKERMYFIGLITFCLVLCLSLFQFTEGEEGQSESVELKYLTDHPETVPNLREIGKTLNKFTGNTWTITDFGNQDLYQSTIRNGLVAKHCPFDMFKWWTMRRMDDIHEQLADTSAIKEHYGKDINPDIWTSITSGGKPKGIPWMVVYYSIWYNKAMFDNLGLSEPKTWEEFLNVCTKIKASGAYPLGAGGMNISDNWTPYIWFSELVMKTDPKLYLGLLDGTVKWNDSRIIKIFEIWKGMYDKDWFIDPSISMYSDLPKAIAREECAMILIASYYTTNLDNVGLISGKTYSTFILPPLNPEVGNLIVAELQPILIPKNTPNLKAALEWCDYLMGPEAQTEWAKLWGATPLNAKADFSVLAPAAAKLDRDIKEGNYKFMTRFEEATPVELRYYVMARLSEFVAKPSRYKEIANSIEGFAKKFWARQRGK